jgi:hypothetical protein
MNKHVDLPAVDADVNMTVSKNIGKKYITA